MITGVKCVRSKNKDIGKGGGAVVYKGKWHQKDAAFKHVVTKTPIRKLSVGCPDPMKNVL